MTRCKSAAAASVVGAAAEAAEAESDLASTISTEIVEIIRKCVMFPHSGYRTGVIVTVPLESVPPSLRTWATSVNFAALVSGTTSW
jgi:hypothetical protein